VAEAGCLLLMGHTLAAPPQVHSQIIARGLLCSLGPRSAHRVGVGLLIIDSSMLVATMQGLPRRRHPCTILLCQ
jgi:hypothetical protein